MHDCCFYSSRASFISVIDYLPSSSSSLCILVWSLTHPPTSRKMWHTRFCSLSVCASHFFIIPRSIDSSASSSAHAVTRPLTPWQPSAKWRQAGSALSADQDVLQQPLSRRKRRSKLLTVEGKKKQITSFTIPTWGGIQHPSAWLRRVIGRFDQSYNATSTRLVTINSFWFKSYIWSYHQRKFIIHGSNCNLFNGWIL